jgi:hypothetical protein
MIPEIKKEITEIGSRRENLWNLFKISGINKPKITFVMG